jgi:hypothetical protein
MHSVPCSDRISQKHYLTFPTDDKQLERDNYSEAVAGLAMRAALLRLLLALPLSQPASCPYPADELARFGWITPVLGDISAGCREASCRYIAALGVPGDPARNATWGPGRLDANGRLPLEGFLSDTFPFGPLDLCHLLGAAFPGCKGLPDSITSVTIKVSFLLPAPRRKVCGLVYKRHRMSVSQSVILLSPYCKN